MEERRQNARKETHEGGGKTQAGGDLELMTRRM